MRRGNSDPGRAGVRENPLIFSSIRAYYSLYFFGKEPV